MREPSPPLLGEGDDDGEGFWTSAPINPSGVQALARREGRVTQSGDGLDGRPDQVVGQGPWYNQAIPGKSGGVVEIRASGHGSEEGEDSITFPERRTRGSRWSLAAPEAGWAPDKGQQNPQEGTPATKAMPNNGAPEGTRT